MTDSLSQPEVVDNIPKLITDDKLDHRTVEAYLLSLPNVVRNYPFGQAVAVYKSDDKMFALIAETSDPLRLSLRCDPQLAVILRDTYETIMPGYQLNKKNWNTIILTGQIEWAEIQGFVRHAYMLVTDKTGTMIESDD